MIVSRAPAESQPANYLMWPLVVVASDNASSTSYCLEVLIVIFGTASTAVVLKIEICCWVIDQQIVLFLVETWCTMEELFGDGSQTRETKLDERDAIASIRPFSGVVVPNHANSLILWQ